MAIKYKEKMKKNPKATTGRRRKVSTNERHRKGEKPEKRGDEVHEKRVG